MTPSTLDPTTHRWTGRREWGINPSDDKPCVVCGIQKQDHPRGTGATERDRLVEVIRTSDPNMDAWDATRLADAIVAARITTPNAGHVVDTDQAAAVKRADNARAALAHLLESIANRAAPTYDPADPTAYHQAVADMVLAAGFIAPDQGNEKMLPFHLNDLGAELFALRDALWMATQALGITTTRPPAPLPNPNRGPVSNRVQGYAHDVHELAAIVHQIRGHLP